MVRTIEIGDTITVGMLADKLSLPATKLITELFKNGVMATINEKIDFDTAQILVGELEIEVELVKEQKTIDLDLLDKQKIVISKNAKTRPPVVAVMGHVDHGKTSLLDVIRTADVVSAESGGITQHISAYQTLRKDRPITFLDTPGHEAFAALREHGAHLTDVVVIVIAADDGIKPQTLEAIRFARKANSKIIIAITKIDKEGANIEKTKQQLVEHKLTPEDWGGDTVVVPISSKTKEGVDKLLDMILLISDIEEFKADYDVPGEGLVIESHMETGRGPLAVALVQQGTVKKGDCVVAGSSYAKIKVLEDTKGKIINEAAPSTPVIIIGFKTLPQFGDHFKVVSCEKTARVLADKNASQTTDMTNRLNMSSNELIRLISQKTSLQELNIIVKADVQGSLTSVIDSLKTLNTDEVAVRVVGSGVGPISENDVRTAAASKAIIYGFHITMSSVVKQFAYRGKVGVRLFKIIYELIDDVKQELTTLLIPEEVVTNVGRLLVKGVFKTTKTETICGGEVTKGKLVYPATATIYRDKVIIAEDIEVTNLKHGPTDANEVLEGEMCGMNLKTTTRLDLQEGDRVELFTKEISQRTL